MDFIGPSTHEPLHYELMGLEAICKRSLIRNSRSFTYKVTDAFSLEKAMTGGGQSEMIQFSQFFKTYFSCETSK